MNLFGIKYKSWKRIYIRNWNNSNVSMEQTCKKSRILHHNFISASLHSCKMYHYWSLNLSKNQCIINVCSMYPCIYLCIYGVSVVLRRCRYPSIYPCMYQCMYQWMHQCIHVCIQVSIHVCIQVSIHVCILDPCILKCIHVSLNVSKYPWMYPRILKCYQVYLYPCINVSTYPCIKVSVYPYIHVSMYPFINESLSNTSNVKIWLQGLNMVN